MRRQIGDLAGLMAEDGVVDRGDGPPGRHLRDADQLALYCRNVIGHPALFTLRLVGGRELSEPAREDAFEVSEMIQLANVSRDIERDLAREPPSPLGSSPISARPVSATGGRR